MKIAFIHDWLVSPGWAEKVFFDIVQDVITQNKESKIYQDLKQFWDTNNIQAEIFTNFHSSNFPNPTKLKINSVLSWKNISKYYRNLLPLFSIFTKILSQKIKKYNPDILIISSFAIWKNINSNKLKILYLHSPMQYIWSHHDEYKNKFTWIKKIIFKTSSKYLKIRDKKYTKFDKIYFNSNYTKELAKQTYWIQTWEVIFPQIEIPNYEKIDVFKKYDLEKNYYLFAWRTVKFVKHLDKIIEVFNKIWLPLVIMWDGPDREYLQNIAKENIKFLWYIPDTIDDYWNIIENSQAVINFTKESFWIVNYQVGKLWKTLISINDGAIQDIPWKKILIKNFDELEKVFKF